MKKASAAGPDAATIIGGHTQASPYKSAAEELDARRKTFRIACQHYAKRIDMEIIRVRERVAGAGEQQTEAEAGLKPPGRNGARTDALGSGQLYDVRDMITLLRTLEVKPLAGRRKDLKKVESLVDELRLLVERWV